MVIDVFIVSSGIPSISARMSPRWLTGTPTFPTSPRDSGWSGSYPSCVGRSNATLNPVCPFARFARKRVLDARALECPEYVRIIHGRSRSFAVFSVMRGRHLSCATAHVKASIFRGGGFDEQSIRERGGRHGSRSARGETGRLGRARGAAAARRRTEADAR